MEISLIPIGNSKGFVLPKAIIEKYTITDKIELIQENGFIILKPKVAPRNNWEKAFKKMNENGDDKLLISDVFEDEKLRLIPSF